MPCTCRALKWNWSLSLFRWTTDRGRQILRNEGRLVPFGVGFIEDRSRLHHQQVVFGGEPLRFLAHEHQRQANDDSGDADAVYALVKAGLVAMDGQLVHLVYEKIRSPADDERATQHVIESGLPEIKPVDGMIGNG